MSSKVKAAVAVAVLLAAAATAVAITQRTPNHGPLYVGEKGDATETSASSDVNGVVTWGGLTLRNLGADPIELITVRLIPDVEGPGVQVDGAFVVDLKTHNGPTTGIVRVWPPPQHANDEIKPVNGYHLQPARTHPAEYMLLIKLTVTREGNWRFGSYEVTYKANGRRYNVTHQDAIRICTPMISDCAKPKR